MHFFFAGAKEESERRRLVHEKLCWSHSLYAGEIAMDEVVGEEGVTADLTQKNNMSTQNETVEAKKETAEATTQHDKSKKVVSLHRRKRNDILINK